REPDAGRPRPGRRLHGVESHLGDDGHSWPERHADVRCEYRLERRRTWWARVSIDSDRSAYDGHARAGDAGAPQHGTLHGRRVVPHEEAPTAHREALMKI